MRKAKILKRIGVATGITIGSLIAYEPVKESIEKIRPPENNHFNDKSKFTLHSEFIFRTKSVQLSWAYIV